MDIKIGDWVRLQGGPQCNNCIAEGTVTYVTTDGPHWIIELRGDGEPRRCWYWKQRHDGGQVLEHRPQ